MNHNLLIAIITLIFTAMGFIVGHKFGILSGILVLAATLPIVLIELFFEKMWNAISRLNNREEQEPIKSDSMLIVDKTSGEYQLETGRYGSPKTSSLRIYLDETIRGMSAIGAIFERDQRIDRNYLAFHNRIMLDLFKSVEYLNSDSEPLRKINKLYQVSNAIRVIEINEPKDAATLKNKSSYPNITKRGASPVHDEP